MNLTFDNFDKALNEGFVIQNDIVYFDAQNSDFINTKFGKGKSRKPYVMKLPFGKLYSVYQSSKETGENYSEILKAIKGQQSIYKIDRRSYNIFIERTALFMASLIRKEEIDTILIMDSSSHILFDLADEINRRLPGYFKAHTFAKTIFKNPDIDSLQISDEFEINDKSRENIEYQLRKAKEHKYFSIRKINPPYFRKMIINWLKLNDHMLTNIVDKNIAILDDIVTTGTTIKEAARLIEDAGAKKLIGITIVKSVHH